MAKIVNVEWMQQTRKPLASVYKQVEQCSREDYENDLRRSLREDHLRYGSYNRCQIRDSQRRYDGEHPLEHCTEINVH